MALGLNGDNTRADGGKQAAAIANCLGGGVLVHDRYVSNDGSLSDQQPPFRSSGILFNRISRTTRTSIFLSITSSQWPRWYDHNTTLAGGNSSSLASD